jgi:protein phosphatase
MGGHAAGEVAARVAVESIENFIRRSHETSDFSWPYGVDASLSYEGNRLKTAVSLANRRINRLAENHDDYLGMGTTVVCALLADGQLIAAHVGDSRLYRQRSDKLEQVTMDHSLLQELVDRGFYSAEEAQRAANKNYVTRALGVEPNVDVEIQEVPVNKGEVFILCSDGLSDMVEDEDIHLTINTFSANLDTVAKQLIQLANDNGGRDNVSVVMAHVIDAFPARTKIFDKILGWFG